MQGALQARSSSLSIAPCHEHSICTRENFHSNSSCCQPANSHVYEGLLLLVSYDLLWAELVHNLLNRRDRKRPRRKTPWHYITILAATNKEIRGMLYNSTQPWIHTALIADQIHDGLGIRMLMRMLGLCQKDFERNSMDSKSGRELVPISYIWYGRHYKAHEALRVSLTKHGSIQRMIGARRIIMSISILRKVRRESAVARDLPSRKLKSNSVLTCARQSFECALQLRCSH
jgi:hypothetical protein